MSPQPVITNFSSASYAQRIAFVCEIANHLHSYGTTAQRLEAAISALANRLGLDCEPWSSPTGLILSFSDPSEAIGTSDITRVIRLEPGENDLSKLSVADEVAESVASGQMSVAQGHTILLTLNKPTSKRWKTIRLFNYGVVAAGIAGLWKLPWLDIITASFIGILIGLLGHFNKQVAFKDASDAIASLLAGMVAMLVACYIGPLNITTVIIASLVALLPGMALTNAVNELSSQHWVSGVARFAGAVTTLLKLTMGAVIAVTLAQLLGMQPAVSVVQTQPDWMEWPFLLICAYAFAVMFKANIRDYPWVMAAAITGYLVSRFVGDAWGSSAGIFVSAMLLTAAGNLFGRLVQRPGAIVRLPGIIMLVPGSMSLRGVLALAEGGDAGQGVLMGVVSIVMTLLAGLLFGNLLVPARKTL